MVLERADATMRTLRSDLIAPALALLVSVAAVSVATGLPNAPAWLAAVPLLLAIAMQGAGATTLLLALRRSPRAPHRRTMMALATALLLTVAFLVGHAGALTARTLPAYAPVTALLNVSSLVALCGALVSLPSTRPARRLGPGPLLDIAMLTAALTLLVWYTLRTAPQTVDYIATAPGRASLLVLRSMDALLIIVLVMQRDSVSWATSMASGRLAFRGGILLVLAQHVLTTLQSYARRSSELTGATAIVYLAAHCVLFLACLQFSRPEASVVPRAADPNDTTLPPAGALAAGLVMMAAVHQAPASPNGISVVGGAAILGLLLVGRQVLSARHAMRVMRAERERLEAEVARRTSELAAVNRALEELTRQDPLTGLANRREFDERFGGAWDSCLRTGSPLSIALLDVDAFKEFNDRYGHQAGDGCLRQVAAHMMHGLRRSTDLAARYGGEEFAVVMPYTDAEGAAMAAHRIRETIESARLPHDASGAAPFITVSIGIATCVPSVGSTAAALLRSADEALYAAKTSGRNRVAQAA